MRQKNYEIFVMHFAPVNICVWVCVCSIPLPITRTCRAQIELFSASSRIVDIEFLAKYARDANLSLYGNSDETPDGAIAQHVRWHEAQRKDARLTKGITHFDRLTYQRGAISNLFL
jgi:hypothetical protein